jgi:hypothetical protein
MKLNEEGVGDRGTPLPLSEVSPYLNVTAQHDRKGDISSCLVRNISILPLLSSYNSLANTFATLLNTIHIHNSEAREFSLHRNWKKNKFRNCSLSLS